MTFASSAVTPEARESQAAAPAAVADATTPVGIAPGLVALALSPFATNTPGVPTDSPGLWAVLAWARREFQQVVLNQSVADKLVQTTETAAADATADLNLNLLATGGEAISPNSATGFAATALAEPAIAAANAEASDTPTVVDLIPLDIFALGVHVSPDGHNIYVAGSGVLNVIDTTTGTVTAVIPVDGTGGGVAVSPDGARAYVLTTDLANFTFTGTVTVIDTATNSIVGNPIPVGDNPNRIVASPDGKHIYVSSLGSVSGSTPPSGTISVIDTTNNTVTATIPVGSLPVGLTMSADGQQLYAVANNVVTVINTATNGVARTIPVSVPPGNIGIVQALAISPDKRRLYAYVIQFDPTDPTGQTGSQSIEVLDPATGNTVDSIALAGLPGQVGAPQGLVLSADGRRLYFTNVTTTDGGVTSEAIVTVFDTSTGTTVDSIPLGPQQAFPGQNALALSADGTRLYVATIGVPPVILVIDTGTTNQTSGGPASPTPIGSIVGRSNSQTAWVYWVELMALMGKTLTPPAPSEPPSNSAPQQASWRMSANELINRVPGPADAIRIETVRGLDGNVRMVLYVSGIAEFNIFDPRFWVSAGEYAEALRGNIDVGKVKLIDEAIESFKPAEIMVVGYSKGGVIAQNIADRYSQVTSLVTFGSPITKSPNYRYSAIHIEADGDDTPTNPTKGTNPVARALNKSVGRVYEAPRTTVSDKHGKESYRRAAQDFEWDRDPTGQYARMRADMDRFEGELIGVVNPH